MANLYKISQTENGNYDTYDSAVVVANSEDEAKQIRPGGDDWKSMYNDWASTPDNVTVELIGTAAPNLEPGTIVVSSFNAG